MQRIFTERAHLMCPNMCFGIAMTVNRPYDEDAIRNAVARLAAAHPFLNALLGYVEVENAYYYRVTERSQVELRLKGQAGVISSMISTPISTPEVGEYLEISTPEVEKEVMDEYRQLTGRDWNLFEEGMLKIAAWPMGPKTQFLLVFHHLLVDGRGALGLAEELAECYVHGTEPNAAPEKLISSIDDFPPDSQMPLISRMLVDRANKNWAKERHHVTYAEYHAFANEFLRGDVIRYSLSKTGPEEVDRIRQKCHEEHVTVNDYLIAKMMLKENTHKVIIASDLRNRLSCYNEGALGNYSTAFSVELGKKEIAELKKETVVRRSKMTNAKRQGREHYFYSLARIIHEKVREIMARPADLYLVLQCYANLDPGILDAALISCKGGFESKTGKFIGSKFFGFEAGSGHSITNLGRIESKSICEAFFIPPASPAIRKTQGILTVNGLMTVCTSERMK